MTTMKITKSKIVATLGPASFSEEKIKGLAERGMDVARINFSHGTAQDKEDLVKLIRNICPNMCILCDIQGPKIRIGNIKGNGAVLVTGEDVTVTTEHVEGDARRFTISYNEFAGDAREGDLVFINDGLVCLKVKSVQGNDIRCKILVGGLISSKKGVNLPQTNISVRVPTSKDVEDLKVIARLRPEYLAISFVRDEKDILTIRDILRENGNESIKLIAKIERPVALKNFDAILGAADGIMVARGDLGVEVPFEQVIPMQKMMIRKSNVAGKPVIVATQMLESMVNAPVPTRAEVSDVFNAIEDGTDAVMLSAETAAGKYPFEAVETMERIIRVAEAQIPPRNPDDFDSSEESIAEIIGHLTHSASKEFYDFDTKKEEITNVKILVLTRSGLSARMVSKYRPLLPIIAVTSQETTAREMRLIWGVEPLMIQGIDDEWNTFVKIQKSVRVAVDRNMLEPTDKIITVGNMNYLPARTNMISIFKVSDIIASEGK